ncbi:MAG TPA: DUF6159 family protein [Aggregatilineales bacterium]|nr:DUF6159 family protein [Aggregatilineales bacterium]
MRARNRITTGGQLARQCWDLLRENVEWIKIPLLSSIGVIIVTVIFAILSALVYAVSGSSADSQNSGSGLSFVGIVLLFLYYFAMYSVVIYSETALVSIVLMKLRGQKSNPTAADGFAVANQRLSAILGFAALSATVGVIARLITEGGRNSKNFIVAIVFSLLASLIQGAWTFMTLLVTPVIVSENDGAFDAIGRSWDLFKKTWGEQVVGRFTLGFFGCLLTLAAMVPGALVAGLGAAAKAPVLVIIGVAGLFVGIAIIALLTSAAGAIFKAVVYLYATEGTTGGLLDEAAVRGVFVPANS